MIKITDKQKQIIIKIIIALFLVYIFALCFTMSIKTKYNTAPDEAMKYDVCKYIYENSKLPHGGEESIRNKIWGISYAFTPIHSYIFSAGFMKGVSLFTDDSFSIFVAARFVSVLCITGYAYLCIKISRKLFKGIYRWVFVAFTTLLPQLLYLGSYLNNDSFALLTISIIVYSWIIGIENNWNWKSCIALGVGVGFCAVSYYNAYGYILTSVIIYFISNYIKKTDIKEFLKKGFTIAGIACLIAGWWFIRNAILYDGDFLALNISREYGQMYAQEPYKPTNRSTPDHMNYTLSQMLYKDMDWIKSTIQSFIGVFGYMSVVMNKKLYYFYMLIGIVGIIGFVCSFIKFIVKSIKSKSESKTKDNNNKKQFAEKVLFNIIMGINIIIPIVLAIYYAYYMDYQAQGRYVMSIIIPFMYFLVIGIKTISETIIRDEKKRKIIETILLSILIILLVILATYIAYVYVVKKL